MVHLIPVQASHSEKLYNLSINSSVTNTIAWDGPESFEDFRKGLIEREMKTRCGESHQFTVVDHQTSEPIGSADVRPISSGALEDAGARKSSYYPSESFKLYATNFKGDEHELADGGITDWTQKLVGSKKERLMISGFGTDRAISLFRVDTQEDKP